MSTSLHSFTPTYHKTSYPAIDPTQTSLSVKGKTVVVTGASIHGIGASVAFSFAKAGAEKIALIGRTESTLLQTKAKLDASFPGRRVEVYVADISSNESLGVVAHYLRVSLGAWDVFVNCAGHLPDATSLAGADTDDDWWKGFEVHVKFMSHFAKHSVPKARPNATYISLSSAAVHVPAALTKGFSAYAASKLAVLKLNEFLAVENPALRVFNVHPGMVDTPMSRKNLAQGGGLNGGLFEWESPELCGDFCVWLVSQDAEFLRGRFVWCNWDVNELVERKGELEKNPSLLTATVQF